MRRGARIFTSCLAALVVVSIGAPAGAPAKALRPISGKLSKAGYTVIALADSGKATTVRVRGHRFRLRPPAALVALHLRAPDGTYAGPIVLDSEQHGRRAVVGVRAGARLGTIKLEARRGYAKLARKRAKRWAAPKRWARAKNGRPIGNGRNVGLVRSRRAHGPRNDPDRDGVPNPLDIDDDGDLILDAYDRSAGKREAAKRARLSNVGSPFQDGNFFDIGTNLTLPGGEGVTNANAGSSDTQIAAALQNGGMLSILWTGVDPGSGELDCGALVYCSAGGSGRLVTPELGFTNRDIAPHFPECCDPDHDGFGSFTLSNPARPGGPDSGGMALFHGATQDQLHAGDVLIEHATIHGAPVQLPSSVGFIFSTFPVLASYDDGQGDSATLAYPREGSPLPVRADPGGDVVVRLTFWRPQRRRIEGEPGEGEWVDIGNLVYGLTVGPGLYDQSGFPFCPQSSYLEVDPNLTLLQPTAFTPGLTGDKAAYLDSEGDRPSSPANTFTVSLDLTSCLASQGLSMNSIEPTPLPHYRDPVQPKSPCAHGFHGLFPVGAVGR